jgi:hypothetical protein
MLELMVHLPEKGLGLAAMSVPVDLTCLALVGCYVLILGKGRLPTLGRARFKVSSIVAAIVRLKLHVPDCMAHKLH